MFAWISLALFTAFLLVAALDGLHYHLHRFRLWAHRDTWGVLAARGVPSCCDRVEPSCRSF